MGQWRPLSNLRHQLSRHPPVVVFFLCLLILSITFVCIGLYTQYHDIKNPDISLDWNQVLGSVAGFKFCTNLNDTAQLEEDSPRMVEHADRTAANVSMSTTHVSFQVPLVLLGDVPAESIICATMLGSQLGMKGAAAKTSVNISLLLQTDVLNSNSKGVSGPNTLNTQTPARTQTRPMLTCLQITALTYVLPQTQLPPECSVAENVDMSTSPVRTVAVESFKHNSPHCFSLQFTPDPHLTVMLTPDEKSMCSYHLLLVSITLLVLCVLMGLCGTFSSSKSPRSYHGNDLLKESLLSP
ncbi:transmembrane protein 248-like isoform X2 [Myxocyprinus asiaticus]|uniref:transmembrane protein 248-like isoform X2 n=1 Tax=Myxocyprinus asiaticus TaxID=70543 RepID=UPI002223CE8D|nr:transmembrane protein 248-like isoform X2 [Myxocyprinus asiaticus]